MPSWIDVYEAVGHLCVTVLERSEGSPPTTIGTDGSAGTHSPDIGAGSGGWRTARPATDVRWMCASSGSTGSSSPSWRHGPEAPLQAGCARCCVVDHPARRRCRHPVRGVPHRGVGASDGLPYLPVRHGRLRRLDALLPNTGAVTASLVTNASLITKVYFPRLLAPIAAVIPGFVDWPRLVIPLVVDGGHGRDAEPGARDAAGLGARSGLARRSASG